ncbi:MAG TPA: methyltransferase domain-containing protein [Aquifex aeolicus]|uniref:Methyltransferase domain-containing protein n=1 Tax=Aquifex aeolicus TaxID=63363 RepID=A0A9D1CF47_AQUAO|nr:methyltransferase domain-containing protein [Aquificales bacterium]HIP98021.1 methyltransferase domain-containing protein [Aquifex aeolicus]HIQ26058.1 methyltransferase domain-containing protein [Aquifex aeolicus]
MEDIFRNILPEEIGRRFSQAFASYKAWAIPQREAGKILIEKFGVFIKKGEIVLDAGAGVGLLTEKLLELCNKVFVCDLSFPSLKENPAVRRAFICNIENLPLKNRSVDWVASNFVLHWCNHKKALGEFLRVSKKGFFFSVPVKGSLEGIGFPFPCEEDILETVKPQRWFTEEIEIPFRGKDFLLFFKKTGTGFNPNKTLSAFEILKKPHLVKNYSFKVLFALKTL